MCGRRRTGIDGNPAEVKSNAICFAGALDRHEGSFGAQKRPLPLCPQDAGSVAKISASPDPAFRSSRAIETGNEARSQQYQQQDTPKSQPLPAHPQRPIRSQFRHQQYAQQYPREKSTQMGHVVDAYRGFEGVRAEADDKIQDGEVDHATPQPGYFCAVHR